MRHIRLHLLQRARLAAILGTGLTEILTVAGLAVAGFILHLTVLALPYDFFGEAEASIQNFTSLSSWIFIAAYGTARLAVFTRAQLGALHEEALEEVEATPLSMGPAAKAQRSARGVPSNTLNREDFFSLLEGELRTARRERKPLSVMLVQVEAHEAPESVGQELVPGFARCLLENTTETSSVGHLGGGLFGVTFPAMSGGKGQRPRQHLCGELLELTGEFGAKVRESFVTLSPGETTDSLYQRAVSGLKRVELSMTGALRRVG